MDTELAEHGGGAAWLVHGMGGSGVSMIFRLEGGSKVEESA
jgi:hypothetical protein